MYRLAIALALILPISAQTEATITGTIRDASGAALPSASITIKSLETGATRHLIADPDLPLRRPLPPNRTIRALR